MSVKFKRRFSGGTGAPAGLLSGQPAWNGVDKTFWIGQGDDGSGNATSAEAVGGSGAAVMLSGAQTIVGVKTFSSPPVIPAAVNGNEPYQKSQADTLLGLKAPLASPTFTGTPAGPTAAAGTSTTQIATTAFVTGQMGAVNGIATLGADGKLTTAQIPSSLAGGLTYQGTWNASSNSPAIPAAAAGNKGQYYKVAVAGTTAIDGIAEWAVGDWIVSNGTAWDKIDNTEAVSSVAGRTGAIVLVAADIGGLGTMATQNVNAVALTGGTIGSAVVIDDGTF